MNTIKLALLLLTSFICHANERCFGCSNQVHTVLNDLSQYAAKVYDSDYLQRARESTKHYITNVIDPEGAQHVEAILSLPDTLVKRCMFQALIHRSNTHYRASDQAISRMNQLNQALSVAKEICEYSCYVSGCNIAHKLLKDIEAKAYKNYMHLILLALKTRVFKDTGIISL